MFVICFPCKSPCETGPVDPGVRHLYEGVCCSSQQAGYLNIFVYLLDLIAKYIYYIKTEKMPKNDRNIYNASIRRLVINNIMFLSTVSMCTAFCIYLFINQITLKMAFYIMMLPFDIYSTHFCIFEMT